MYSEKIVIKDDNINSLERIFAPEEKSLQTQRFSYKLEKTNDELIFHIHAKDKIAFKTIKTSVTKLLKTYHKIKELSINSNNA